MTHPGTHPLEQLQPWQLVWRYGLAPNVPDRGLQALAQALRNNDPTLVQRTTYIPTLKDVLSRVERFDPLTLKDSVDWKITGACPLAYAAWKGYDLVSVWQTINVFSTLCQQCLTVVIQDKDDAGINEVVRNYTQFFDWVDETSRDEMRARLLPEVERELERRKSHD